MIASQIRVVPPLEAVAKVWPSGLKATVLIDSPSCKGVARGLPVIASQIRVVPSLEAVARVWPSGLKARALTDS